MKKVYSKFVLAALFFINITTTFAAENDVPHQGFKEYFIKGGPAYMAPILLCLIIGLAVAIERVIYLTMATTNTKKLLENVVEKVENISKNSEIIISYIDISSINNLKNRIETYKNYYIDEAPSRAKKIINRNDILISTVRPNLKNIALFDIETENKAIASTGFCILRIKTKLNTLYLFNVLLSNSFTNELSKKEIGANYPAVTENDIKNVKIALPPLTLQNEFSQFVEKTDKS